MKIFTQKAIRTTAAMLLLVIVSEIFLPLTAFALTGGPKQPEFSSFEPVTTTNMVDPFTGSFTYNLPLLEVPGPHGSSYPIALSYHSGTTVEEEASWVGYGWTLNPGAITRNKRGFPDDYNGAKVEYWNKMVPNVTMTANASMPVEAFSFDALTTSMNASLRYNNYKGFGFVYGMKMNYDGVASLGYSVDDRGPLHGSFSFSVSAATLFDRAQQAHKKNESSSMAKSQDGKEKEEEEKEEEESFSGDGKLVSSLTLGASEYGIHSFADVIRSTNVSEYTGGSWTIEGGAQFDPLNFPVGVDVKLSGSIAYQENTPHISRNTYGHMYSANATEAQDIMDYYVEKGSGYNKRDDYLGIPFSNADIFSVSGEGVRGGFRGYSRNVGQFRPNAAASWTVINPKVSLNGLHGGPLELGLGLRLAGGREELNVGPWENSVSPNTGMDNTRKFTTQGDEPVFFRFNNDLGGNIDYSVTPGVSRSVATGRVESAVPDGPHGAPINGLLWYDYKTDNIPTKLPGRSGRSSHIAYSTGHDYLDHKGGIHYRAHNKRRQVTNFDNTVSKHMSELAVDTDYKDGSQAFRDQLAEFSVTAENGMRYVYGLPVYARNEVNVQFNAKGATPADLDDNFILYRDIGSWENEEKVVIGEVRNAPYSTSYLLTEIVTPDYVDRTNNGPTDDDFGGYIKFNYRWVAGAGTNSPIVANGSPKSQNKLLNVGSPGDPGDPENPKGWYRWRMPYTGFLYEKNSLSDPGDDAITMMSGEKQIYYLSSVETKSHIAFFVTNNTRIGTKLQNASGSYSQYLIKGTGFDRRDAFEAPSEQYADNNRQGTATAENYIQYDDDTRGKLSPTNKVEVLERIELYAKGSPDPQGSPAYNNYGQYQYLSKLMKTVHLQYSYRLCKNLPNSAPCVDPFDEDSELLCDGSLGKLTLEKVWFEYEGVANAKISPYIFGYEYKTVDYPGKYADIADEMNAAGNQNPDYDRFATDRWGFYQANGRQRRSQMKPWVDQTPDYSVFDPAAWQLKWIQLPSGGEIHVQYEQNDYAFVQDRPAMAMARLQGVEEDHDGRGYDRYFLDLRELYPASDPASPQPGVVSGTGDLKDADEADRLVSLINKAFVSGPVDGSGKEAEQDKYKQFIYFRFLYSLLNGEAAIDNCMSEYIKGYARVVGAEKEAISTAGPLRYRISIKIQTPSNPWDPNRKWSPRELCSEFISSSRSGMLAEQNCTPSSYGFELNDIGAIPDKLWLNVRRLSNLFFNTFTAGTNYCANLSTEHSYLRIPLTQAKKGGGIRVRRIMMLDKFDKEIEGPDNEAALYGTEYLYTLEDGITSSGVAANEPSEGREENALVVNLKKRSRERNVLEVLASGEDLEQFEGPLGESILPGAAVGYSRVVAKSIHSGKTNTGFVISEFYTAKDYPFDRVYEIGSEGSKKPEEYVKGVDYTRIMQPTPDHVAIDAPRVSFLSDKEWATQGYRFIINSMHGQMKRVASYGGDYDQKNSWYLTSLQEQQYFEPGEKVNVLTKNESGQDEIAKAWIGKEEEVVTESRQVSDITASLDLGADFTLAIWPPNFSYSIAPNNVAYNEHVLRMHATTTVVRYPALTKSVLSFRDGIYTLTENLAFDPSTGKPVITRSADGYYGVAADGTHKKWYNKYSFPAWREYSEMGQKAANERYKVQNLSRSYVAANPPSQPEAYFTVAMSASQLKNFSAGDLLLMSPVSGSAREFFHVRSVGTGNVTLLPAYYGDVPAQTATTVNIEILRSGRSNQLDQVAGTVMTYGEDWHNSAKQLLLEDVIAASAQTYSDEWGYDPADYIAVGTVANAFESGMRGKWRTKESFIFRTGISGGLSTAIPNFERGKYSSFTRFDWKAANPAWTKTNTIEKYSPNGDALEERDILNIYSAARFGYKQALPTIIAKNAAHGSLVFESFEDPKNINASHIGLPGKAHSGSRAKPVGQGTLSFSFAHDNTKATSDRYILQYWARCLDDGTLQDPISIPGPLVSITQSLQPLRVGEWALYTKYFDVGNNNGIHQIHFQAPGNESIYLDDVRIQPIDAQATCYVYDPASLRLLASFDDQHFALFYQYNGEGKLVRKLKETERGVKTIAETQYNTPKSLPAKDTKPYTSALILPPGQSQTAATLNVVGDPQASASQAIGRSQSPEARAAAIQERASANRARINTGRPRQANNESKFEALDISINPDKQKLRIMGSDSMPKLKTPDIALPELRRMDSLKLPKLRKIGSIPDSLNIALPDTSTILRNARKAAPKELNINKSKK